MSAGRGAIATGCLLALLSGCAEAPQAPPDEGLPPVDLGRADVHADQGADRSDGTELPDGALDAGRPIGADCLEDRDCAGICVDDGAGLRCARPCVEDQDCLPGEGRCLEGAGRLICAEVAASLPLGAPCDGPGARCADPGRCVDDGLSGARCRRLCGQDMDCAPGDRCAPEGVCLDAAADPFSCATLGCLDPGLRCVRLVADGPADCAQSCFDADRPCPEGGACVAPAGAEGLVCVPVVGQEGDRCGAGGRCAPGLRCLARAPGDPAARCAALCEAAGCAEGFSCRRPTGFTQRWCLPAPFGIGDEAGGAGAPCDTHGATDCAPDLDCVAGVAGFAVCAAPCLEGECPPGARCVPRRLDGPYCLPGEGGFGSACSLGSDCGSGLCAEEPDPEARFCTAECGVEACPPHATCEAGQCRPLGSDDRAAPLGASCAGGVACDTGLCAVDPEDGQARCTQGCADAEPSCPPGFTCRQPVGGGLCFPQD